MSFEEKRAAEEKAIGWASVVEKELEQAQKVIPQESQGSRGSVSPSCHGSGCWRMARVACRGPRRHGISWCRLLADLPRLPADVQKVMRWVVSDGRVRDEPGEKDTEQGRTSATARGSPPVAWARGHGIEPHGGQLEAQ